MNTDAKIIVTDFKFEVKMWQNSRIHSYVHLIFFSEEERNVIKQLFQH